MKFTSLLSTALVALSLGVEYISAQTLVPGVYQFASTVTDPNGNRLALTDQGLNQPVTLAPLFFNQTNQRWTVVASITGDTSFNVIAPSSTSAQTLQVGPAGNIPGPLNTVAGTVVWRSQFTPNVGFTFVDTTIGTTNWGVSVAINTTGLNAVPASSSPLNAWVPIRIS